MSRGRVPAFLFSTALVIGLICNPAVAGDQIFESLDFGFTMRGQRDYMEYSIDLEPVLILDSANWFVRGEITASWIRTDDFNQFSSNIAWYILSGIASVATGSRDFSWFWVAVAPSMYLEKSIASSWNSRVYLGYRTDFYLIPIRLDRDQDFRYGVAWFPEVGFSQRLAGFVFRIGAGYGRFVDFEQPDRSLGWHAAAGVAIFNLPAHSQ